MQFVRTIVQSNRLANIVDIPMEFRNKNVEVLILPLIDNESVPKKKIQSWSF